MPELPEIEALRRELEKDLSQKKVKLVEVSTLKSIKRYRTKKAFTSLLEGKKIIGFERRGPFLVAKIEGGDALVVDLGANGQLVRTRTTRTPVTKATQVVITFTQGGQLRLVDPKADASLWVAPYGELADSEEFSGFGIDPLEASISWDSFGRIIWARHTKLKPMLMDRSVFIGIGPVYSDEILFASGLRYDRESDQLTEQEIRRLYRAIIETMQDAVKFRSSAANASSSANGRGSASANDPFDDDHSDHFKVWERDGQSCRRCRRDIVKARVGGRMIYFCEACQV